VSLGAYLAGWLVLAAVLAGPLLGAWLVVRRRLAWMAIEARVVVFALLLAGFVFIEHLVPLALGVLSRGTVIAASVLVGLAASRIRPAAAREQEPLRGEPGDTLSWRLALVVVGFVAAFVIAFLAENRAVALGDVDATGFHLPVVARWIQDGTLWKLNDFAPGWGFGEYPHTGNVLQLSVVLPWHDDFLLRAVGPLFVLLTALAIYALAAELGAPRPAASIFAALFPLVPTVAFVGLNHGQTDLVAAAGFATGALFLARHARTGRREELLLAALGLGLAFGTKWYGPPEAIAVILVWVVARSLMSRNGGRWRPSIADGALVGGIVLLVGGIWMVRNGALAGDPVFPRRVGIGGVTLFSGTHSASEPYDFALAHYLSDTHLLTHGIRGQFERTFGAPGLLIVLSAICALLFAARARRGVPLTVALASLVLLAVYVVTPYTAQGPDGLPQVTAGVRYALPALAVGAAVAAWLAGRLGRAGTVGAFTLVALAMVQAVDKIRARSLEFHHTSFGTVLAVGFVLVLLGALALRLRETARPTPRLIAGGVAAVALLVLLIGRDVQTTFDKHRYRIIPTYAWIQTVPKKPIRIGLAGRNGNNQGYSSPYIAFGPRLRNHVEYVGQRRHHLLVAYHERAAFVAALQRGRFDVLMVGPEEVKSTSTTLGRPLAWAKSAGWRPFLHDARFTLLAPPK
jgi:dolichyl-phosphate-mannose-protein mannosyltransferase